MPTPPHGGGSGNGSELNGVSCTSADACVAVGMAGPTGSMGHGFSGAWNGKTWKFAAAA